MVAAVESVRSVLHKMGTVAPDYAEANKELHNWEGPEGVLVNR